MKAHSIEWSTINTGESRIALDPARQLEGLLRLVARALLAIVPALAIVTATAWLINLPDLVVYLQVLIWAGGFIFLALAIEAESAELSILNLATGIALPVLAVLSAKIAIELLIIPATLVAAWVAVAILRR